MNVTLSVETAGQRTGSPAPRPKNSWRRAMSSARAGP